MEHKSQIAWKEWSAEAFAEAQSQDKPVLLDIGAVWCHWCHVMDTGIAGDSTHTGTYSNPDVQKRIADNFIAIKVDNDRRPDINARYNMGGWPTTAFLTPSGDTLYGETYVPPGRMIALLDHITDVWRNHKGDVTAQAANMRAQRTAAAQESPASDLDPKTAYTVSLAIKQHFDPEFGGFGTQPKFPHPDTLLLALEQYALTGDDTLREFAVKTLRGMADGGMYDRFAGGFFRYSTTRDWSIPHFEKMLEDNAKMTRVYAIASQVLGDDTYMDTVRTAHNWLHSDMRDPETGTFAGSQDADTEEAYYGQPLSVRESMPTPYIDRTVYTGWNALMVSSLAARYKITGEEAILAAAQKAFLGLRNMADDETSETAASVGVLHCIVGGVPQELRGILSDQTAMLDAALDLYEAAGHSVYKQAAMRYGNYLLTLEDQAGGGFFDFAPQSGDIGELARPKKDIGDNAAAALALLRLAALTDDKRYRESSMNALKVFVDDYGRMSYFAASYARAVEAALRPPLHVVVVGDGDDPRRCELQQAAWSAIAPGKLVETLGISEAAAREFPAGEDGSPRAYVCIGEMCLAPVSDPGALAAKIEEALRSE